MTYAVWVLLQPDRHLENLIRDKTIFTMTK